MLVPVKVPVLGYDIVIKYTEEVTVPTEGYETRALYQSGDKSIKVYLTCNNSASELLHTIKHELVHAALDISGQGELLGDKQEEAICELMAHAFGLSMVFGPKAGVKFKDIKMPWEDGEQGE